MKMRHVKSVIVFILFIHFFLFINSQNIYADPLEVGVIDFPPFYVVKSAGPAEGILIDLISKVLKRASIDYVVRDYPSARLYKYIVNGKTHIWMGGKDTPIYKDHILTSKFPVISIEMRIYTMGDKKLPATKEELIGKKIITMRGYGYSGLITFLENPENNITLSPSNSHESTFLKLKNGRADYLLNYKHPAEKTLKSLDLVDLKLNSLFKIPIYITVSKKTPNAEKVLRRIEETYQQLRNEGEFE